MTLENDTQTQSSMISKVFERKSVRMGIISLLLICNFIPLFLVRFFGYEMYPFFFIFYLWVPIYLVFIFILIFSSRFGEIKSFVLSASGILFLMFITIVSRLAFYGTNFALSLDTLWYLDYGAMMLNGHMPYADFYFLYPPIFGYFIWAISYLYPTIDSFRILSTLFDTGIVIVIWSIIKKREFYKYQEIIPIAYAILPISIIESGLNGHFEPIANLLLLVGLWSFINKKYTIGSLLIGLSAATKIYALFLFPLLLLIIPSHRQKILSIIIAGTTFFVAFIPFSIPVWLRGDWIFPGMPMPGNETGFMDSTLGFLGRIDLMQIAFFTIVVTSAVIIILYSLYKVIRQRGSGNLLFYHILVFSLGITLLCMSLLAAIYPFTNIASTMLWRFPADIALLKGILGTFLGGIIIYTAISRYRSGVKPQLEMKEIVLVGSSLMFLILSLARQAFFGWYFLWCLIPLMLLRDRRILLTAFICILILYPTYTHDNFQSLGVDEETIWLDTMDDISAWTHQIEAGSISNTSVEVSTSSRNGIASFSCEIPSFLNSSQLESLRITWHRNTSIQLQLDTTLIVDISVNWNPSSEKWADVFLRYQGYDNIGSPVNGTILSNSTIYTSHSYFQWRYSFEELAQVLPVEITMLSLDLCPVKTGNLSILMREMYTVADNRLLFYPLESLILVLPIATTICLLWNFLPDTLFLRKDTDSGD